jgi:hypothetical protein
LVKFKGLTAGVKFVVLQSVGVEGTVAVWTGEVVIGSPEAGRPDTRTIAHPRDARTPVVLNITSLLAARTVAAYRENPGRSGLVLSWSAIGLERGPDAGAGNSRR